MKPSCRPFALAAAIAALLPLPSAGAGDIQGDAYDCGELWTMRNEIYKRGGYCFKTSRAIAQFGNAGCQYDQIDDVPLSNTDRSVVSNIKKSERRQGCR
jgi:hypothetical protein